MGRVFSYEICEILKNAFLTEHLRATASNCQTEKWVFGFLAIPNTLQIEGISEQNHPRKQDFLRSLKDRYMWM